MRMAINNPDMTPKHIQNEINRIVEEVRIVVNSKIVATNVICPKCLASIYAVFRANNTGPIKYKCNSCHNKFSSILLKQDEVNSYAESEYRKRLIEANVIVFVDSETMSSSEENNQEEIKNEVTEVKALEVVDGE